jgi:hypothetical protein
MERVTMSKRVKLPPTVKARSRVKPGKGWRLVNARRTGSLKAALVSSFNIAKDRYLIFKVRD